MVVTRARPARSSGRSRPTSATWPMWFVPNWSSRPSAVVCRVAGAITPALSTRMLIGPPARFSASANAATEFSEARSSSTGETTAPGTAARIFVTADEAERLIDALEREQPESLPAAALRPKPRPRYLRVVVNSAGQLRRRRAGPGQRPGPPTTAARRRPAREPCPPAGAHPGKRGAEQVGVPIDLTQLKPQHIEEAHPEQLGDLTVDVDQARRQGAGVLRVTPALRPPPHRAGARAAAVARAELLRCVEHDVVPGYRRW